MPRVVTQKPPGEKRWKYSQYFLTINTNQTDYDPDKLKSALGQLFSNDEMFYKLVKGDGEKIDKEWSTVQFSVEKGPKTGFIHAHALIRLRHTTMTHFNVQLLHKVLEKQLGLTGVHVDIKASGISTKTLEEYVFKMQQQ